MGVNKSQKISELESLHSLAAISKYKAKTWLPAALLDSETNSYKNVSINLDAITNYCNSYSSYILTYTLSNYHIGETTYITYNQYSTGVDNTEVISYVSSYTSTLLNEAVERLSDKLVQLYSNVKPSSTTNYTTTNNSKKISELTARETMLRHQDHSWLPLAQYDSRDNTYRNLAISLKTITDYCNTYTYNGLLNIDERLKSQETTINKILNSYLAYITYGNSVPPAYIMSYCSTYTSYLIQNATEKITKNMVDLINSIKKGTNNSYVRNNSKKISELTARETMLKHQDHTWIPIAQYDGRDNTYRNLAINLQTITGYCNTYSYTNLSYESYNINNKIDNFKNYVNNDLTYQIISYSFSYTKDYFEWQFL